MKNDYPPGYSGSKVSPPSYHPEEEEGAKMRPWEYYEAQQAEAMRPFDEVLKELDKRKKQIEVSG